MTFDDIKRFETALAEFTGAPYAIMTDCCTHAIEMCLRYDGVRGLKMTPYTYLSIPMTMHKLGIDYVYLEEDKQEWVGEYEFRYTRVWDCARRLEKDMYRSGTMQCLSFGYDKPLHIGRGGAILTDDVEIYDQLSQQRYDGRELQIIPWQEQKVFKVGYHYKPTTEEAELGLKLLPHVNETPKFVAYPDCREITITD